MNSELPVSSQATALEALEAGVPKMFPGYAHGQQLSAEEFAPTRLSVLGTDELSILKGRDNQRIFFPDGDVC